ncbi:hypothetical protein H4R34_003255 [Dimargaris verticillata]|uniref:Uncharacterized protein n=1 Tax=Dimargaris verticillata TaxID=2761393 RepID=A0A9W8B790_9FUNG|nr:hypothetical protein H4R34_003255 [Dimargaris verticillata]
MGTASPEVRIALHEFRAEHEDEISFGAGERVVVLERDEVYNDGWWQGRNEEGQTGLFPVNFTQPLAQSTARGSSPSTNSVMIDAKSYKDLINNLEMNFRDSVHFDDGGASAGLHNLGFVSSQGSGASSRLGSQTALSPPVPEATVPNLPIVTTAASADSVPADDLAHAKLYQTKPLPATPTDDAVTTGSSPSSAQPINAVTATTETNKDATKSGIPDVPLTGQPENWSIEQVAVWLDTQGFGSLVPIFVDNEISGDVLLELNLTTLKELQIKTFGKRYHLMNAIIDLRKQNSEYDGTQQLSIHERARLPSATTALISPMSQTSNHMDDAATATEPSRAMPAVSVEPTTTFPAQASPPLKSPLTGWTSSTALEPELPQRNHSRPPSALLLGNPDLQLDFSSASPEGLLEPRLSTQRTLRHVNSFGVVSAVSSLPSQSSTSKPMPETRPERSPAPESSPPAPLVSALSRLSAGEGENNATSGFASSEPVAAPLASENDASNPNSTLTRAASIRKINAALQRRNTANRAGKERQRASPSSSATPTPLSPEPDHHDYTTPDPSHHSPTPPLTDNLTEERSTHASNGDSVANPEPRPSSDLSRAPSFDAMPHDSRRRSQSHPAPAPLTYLAQAPGSPEENTPQMHQVASMRTHSSPYAIPENSSRLSSSYRGKLPSRGQYASQSSLSSLFRNRSTAHKHPTASSPYLDAKRSTKSIDIDRSALDAHRWRQVTPPGHSGLQQESPVMTMASDDIESQSMGRQSTATQSTSTGPRRGPSMEGRGSFHIPSPSRPAPQPGTGMNTHSMSSYGDGGVGGTLSNHAVPMPGTGSMPTGSNPSPIVIGKSTSYHLEFDDIQNPDFQGLMKKRSAGYPLWHTRWFVLKGQNLYYFKSQRDTVCRGIVNLQGYRIVPDENIRKGKYCFKCIHESKRTYYFCHDDAAEVREWMKMLLKATIGGHSHLVSSSNINTVPLHVAQGMRPRPPSLIHHGGHDLVESGPAVAGAPAVSNVLNGPLNADTHHHSQPADHNTDSREFATSDQFVHYPSRQSEAVAQTAASPMASGMTTSQYIKWINHILSLSRYPMVVEDMFEDLRTGVVLVRFVEALAGQDVEMDGIPMDLDQVSPDLALAILQRVFEFMQSIGIYLEQVPIASEDIMYGDRAKTMAMLTLIRDRFPNSVPGTIFATTVI